MIQGPSKRPSSGLLYPVSPVKERNRKGVKYKISRVLQSPVSSLQAQHSTCPTPESIRASNSGGMVSSPPTKAQGGT